MGIQRRRAAAAPAACPAPRSAQRRGLVAMTFRKSTAQEESRYPNKQHSVPLTEAGLLHAKNPRDAHHVERHPEGVTYSYQLKQGGRSEPLRFLFLSLRRDLEHRRRPERDARLGDFHLDDVLAARKLEHHVHEDLFEDRAKAARTSTATQRFLSDRAQGTFLEADLHLFE